MGAHDMKHHIRPHSAPRVRRTAIALSILAGCALVGLPAQATGLHGWIPEFNLELKPLGTYANGIINADPSSAEIPAYDPLTRRVFVVNGAQKRVDALAIQNPSTPTNVFSIDLSAFGAPNSVAVKRGVVAIAVENGTDKQAPGWVMLYDVNGRFLNQLPAGALPDMITFTPDGSKILVANEGEPSADYLNDPEGSITAIPFIKCEFYPVWVSILRAKMIKATEVKQIGFTQFNAATLDSSIRIYGPGATVAKDLEPEYIAVSPDSKTALVTLQENNALAMIDLTTYQVTKLTGLGFKDHHALAPVALQQFDFGTMPDLAVTEGGQTIKLGGFSGLHFEGIDTVTGNYKFITHPDRGPNAEPRVHPTLGTVRPFPLPDFQLRWVRFELNPLTGHLAVTQSVGLTDPEGIPLTGLPNLAGKDEKAVGPFGNLLPLDPLGGDLEGIVRSTDGTWWMVDEYRPAIYRFDAAGKLIKRYVPAGWEFSPVDSGKLPAVIGKRRANRGFEGVAFQGGKVYAFVQSPIENPNTSTRTSKWMRVVEFDPATETTTGMFLYPRVTEIGAGSDKIGDMVASPIPGEFYVLERDDIIGPTAVKNIFRIQIGAGSNLAKIDESLLPETPEQMGATELAAAGLKPVSKELVVDLAAAGYDLVDKPEGLALVDYNTLVVINDNDFNLDGTVDFATGQIGFRAQPQPIRVALIDLSNNGLDASDRDNKINFVNWPVFGMYQPDAIDSFSVGGQTYYIAANEGDAREYIYKDTAGKDVIALVEEARVSALTLDPTAFPNGAALKGNANLGRLTVTKAAGDIDGDGDFDALYAPGGRSFSIYDSAANRIYDSGDLIEAITAVADPLNFNSNRDANGTFDTRSDNKGPEPEGVVVGEILGRPFAFIGLERVGGVLVFDLSNPAAPKFVDYLNNRDFAGNVAAGTAGDSGPEGLRFIPWWQSPTLKPMLVVSNESSGTTTVYELAVSPITAP